jgi:3-hydroxyacyl-CoA dehydrogenase
MEIKKQNFKRIAESRVNKILSLIELLGNLSNKSFYDFSDDQVDLIFTTIQEALEVQRKRFERLNSKRSNKRFEL